MDYGITQDNFLHHLDELTDEQITEYLRNDPVYREDWEYNRQQLATTPKEKWSQSGLMTTRTDRLLATWLRYMP